MSGFDLDGKEAAALLEAAETLNSLHDQALRRIATLEARLARVLQAGKDRLRCHRGHVWSRSRAKPGGR